MKKLKIIVTALSIFSITCFIGCEKNAVEDITVPYNGALFKFYNFALSSPTVNAYANNTKFTAIASLTGTESAAGTSAGGVAPARGYSLVQAGSNIVFRVVTPSTMAASATTGFGPNLEIASVTASIEDGKNYSFYASGVFNKTTQKADCFIIEDKLPQPDSSASYIRLVNPGHNTSTLSLEITRTFKLPDGSTATEVTTPITGVAYKAASPFVKVAPGSYTLKLTDQATGKSVTRAATGFAKNRVYTFTLRGDLISGVASSPTLFLDFTENR
ncbi:hypothetical protein [Pedobacter sp.]|uniref:hypothetical protein n=1 Tax=Pedobacter sp. TaxID=1411316 RepID=UPI00396C4315